MRDVAIALAAASIIALCSVAASAAPHWVQWREGFWLDMNSLMREGAAMAFDVIQGDGDPVAIARNPDLHQKNLINCATRSHNVYSPIMNIWTGWGNKWDHEDEALYKLVCKRNLKD